MMTKRVMIKKFMNETGADKKTAMKYLRLYQWNYYRAVAMYDLPERLNKFRECIKEIDWTAIVTSFGKALEECMKSCSEAIKKIQEEIGESNEDSN